MNADQACAWLALLGEEQVEVGEEWVKSHCPLAPWSHRSGRDRTPSFGVRIEPGDSLTHCFGCGFSGRQTRLLRELSIHVRGQPHDYEISQAMDLIVAAEEDEATVLRYQPDEGPRDDVVFPEDWLSSFSPAHWTDGSVHPYLVERQVPHAVVEFLDLRFMFSEQRVCFPIRNWSGRLVGLHGRAVLKETEPKYRMITWKGKKNPVAWLGEHWVDPDVPVVLAESVFDLARVFQVYRNVMCPLTASISVRKVERISDHVSDVVTLFDPGEAGDFARDKVETVMRGHARVRHAVPVGDDDPGDMSPGEVSRYLEEFVDLDDTLL